MSTITAIGTALGTSGISIVRISGSNSLHILSKIFDNYEKLKPNSIIYGKIKDEQEFVDNVLVSYFKSPYSFTGEDICEINCHGGSYITKRILSLVIKNGAILAEPGEFSKRAFLNGKIDLSEAESIIDLINSKTRIEAKIATNQINGQLYSKISGLREKLIEVIANIEVSIDYPEYDYEEVKKDNIIKLIVLEIDELNKLINSYEEGKYIKKGINVAILGKPNVGKSSLLNNLAKQERVIVTDIAGTTRDVVEESIVIKDVIFNISDTAGIRETEDVIEKLGVEKSIKKLDEVDLVIYMFDVENDTREDFEMLSKIKNKGIKYITAINKVDKTSKLKIEALMSQIKGDKNTINISVTENKGIEELKEKMIAMFFEDDMNSTNEIVIVNERHKNLLEEAIKYLKIVKEETENNMPIDLIYIKLRESSKKLGEIIGADISQDVVNKIFEKFCLGK